MQDQVNHIERSLGRVEGSLNAIEKHLEAINGQIINHAKLLNKTENDLIEIKTKATIYGSMAGIGIIAIWEFFKDKLWK